MTWLTAWLANCCWLYQLDILKTLKSFQNPKNLEATISQDLFKKVIRKSCESSQGNMRETQREYFFSNVT